MQSNQQHSVSHQYPNQHQVTNIQTNVNRGSVSSNNHLLNNHNTNQASSFYTSSPSYSPQPKYYQNNASSSYQIQNQPSNAQQYARYRSPTAPNASPVNYNPLMNRNSIQSNPPSHYNNPHNNPLPSNQFRRVNNNIQAQDARNRAQSAAVYTPNMNNMYRVTSAHSAESNQSLHSAQSNHSTHSQHTATPPRMDSISSYTRSSGGSVALRRERKASKEARPRTASTQPQNKRNSNKNTTNSLQPLRLTNTTSNPSIVHRAPLRLNNVASGPPIQQYNHQQNNNNHMRLTNVASGPQMQRYNDYKPQNEVHVFAPNPNQEMKLPDNIGITEYNESDYTHVKEYDPYYQKPKLQRAETEPTHVPPPPQNVSFSVNRANYGYSQHSVNDNSHHNMKPQQMQYGFSPAYNQFQAAPQQYNNNGAPSYPQGMMYNTMVYNQYQAYNPNNNTTNDNHATESESESGSDSSESRSSEYSYSGSTSSRSYSDSSASSKSHSTNGSSQASESSKTHSHSYKGAQTPATTYRRQDTAQTIETTNETLPRKDSMVSTSTMGTMVYKDDKTKRNSRRWSDPDDYKAMTPNVMTPLSPIIDVGFGDMAEMAYAQKYKTEDIAAHLLLIGSKKKYEKSEKSAGLLHRVLSSKRRGALFAGLDDKMMDKMVDRMYRVECSKNECIIKQNEKGDAYFVVESGKFNIIRNGTIVGQMAAKSAFGEASLLYATPRSATIKAKQNSVAWALDAVEFRKIRAKLSKKKIKKTRKKMKVLEKMMLFNGLHQMDLMDLAEAMKAILYKKGEHLISTNEENNHFFVVYKGICRSNIAEYREGDYFGERTIMKNIGSDIQVTAVSDEVICYVLNCTEFLKFLAPKTLNIVKNRIYDIPLLNLKFRNVFNDLKLSQFISIGVIGVGRFGEISLVENPLNVQTYALKKIRKNRIANSHSERHIRSERAILSTLKSLFCVKLYATYADPLNVYLLQEAILGGELFDLLNFNKRFPEKTARFYAACVILAFEHLHAKNVIFRHLKPQNLLVTENGYLKLIDFGFAKIRNDSCTFCGTPEYLAPEVIQCAHQSFTTDWWTLGVFIYQMIVGVVPFQDDPNLKMYDKILSSSVVFPPKIKISQSGKDLITSLLRKHPYKRLGSGFCGTQNIKHHKWYQADFNWTQMEKHKMVPPYLPTIANNKDISNFNTFKPQNMVETLIADKSGKLFAWCDEF